MGVELTLLMFHAQDDVFVRRAANDDLLRVGGRLAAIDRNASPKIVADWLALQL